MGKVNTNYHLCRLTASQLLCQAILMMVTGVQRCRLVQLKLLQQPMLNDTSVQLQVLLPCIRVIHAV